MRLCNVYMLTCCRDIPEVTRQLTTLLRCISSQYRMQASSTPLDLSALCALSPRTVSHAYSSKEAQHTCTEARCCKIRNRGVCLNAGLKAQLEQLSQQVYQSSGSSAERENAELQQKVHGLQETVSQLTAQHSVQPGTREAELEQEYKEKLSALKSQESQQCLTSRLSMTP